MRMNTLPLLLLGLVVAPTAARAQEIVRRVTTPEAAEVVIFRALLTGIELTPAQVTEAKKVIRDEAKAQFALTPGDPDLWQKRVRLNFVRDSTLRHLISRPADLKLFDQRSARMRPRVPGGR